MVAASPQISVSRRPAPVRTLWVAALAAVAVLALPAGARAAVTTFGSPLNVAATKDTAANLNYAGTNAIQNGTGVVIHNDHDGADTALWNLTMPHGAHAGAPAGGQITAVRLEGCAEPAAGGPAPLTQIHFQALTPISGGGVHVDVTSQALNIPTCGAGKATPRTVTTYRPINMCVNRGDIVDFNDEGGFNPAYYPSGVHYRVIGAVGTATMDSFIANNGTNNGTTFTPSEVAPTSGFAGNPHEELLLQSTLATGVDATSLCPGGLHGDPGMPGGKPALAFGQATAGINHDGYVPIALYCALIGRPCRGTLKIVAGGRTLGSVTLSAPTGRASTTRIDVGAATLAAVRKHGDLSVVLVAHLSGAASVSHPLRLRL